MDRTPIACTLSPEELRARRNDLLPGLAARATTIERLDEGVRLTFRSTETSVSTIAAVVDAERHCCRFLHFEITAPADGADVVLTITAPPAAFPLLTDLIAAAAPAAAADGDASVTLG